MNRNTIIISIISVVAIFGFLGIVYVATNKPVAPQIFPETKVLKTTDHITWSPAKKNLLVEYSDLQCPACRAYHQIIKEQIEPDKSITGNITFVYRHFPLTQHVYSHIAAYAAEAAGKQNKFFEFADILFDNQDDWAQLKSANDVNNYFLGVAKDLKLDVDKFKTDMESVAVKQTVDSDVASGTAVSVDATPTFFLNGAKLDNIRSFEDFKKALQSVSK